MALSSTDQQASFPSSPPSPESNASLISLDEFSDSQLDLDRLELAVEEIPDSEPEDHLLSTVEAARSLSQEDSSSDAVSQNFASANGTLVPPREIAPRPRTNVDRQIQALAPQTQPWQLQDLLSLSGQTLGVASTASSAGFSFAREATAISLNIAKRLTQVAVALPAMAIDAAAGTAPGSGTPTAAALAHQSVGGFFDLMTTLALGGIDLGSALTSAGLGAASTGIEGIRRSLGSEVVKALGQFVKLVQREWNAQDDSLPPGGIPGFGVTGVTRALIVWICIQMVTREEYEKRMLKELQEIDIEALRAEIEEEQRAAARSPAQGGGSGGTGGLDASNVPGAPAGTIRITSEASDQAGGEVIGAEIGSRQAKGTTSHAAEPLSDKEAMQGLLRYSSMVLAVYGGTALAWFGKLPTTDAEAARAAPRWSAPTRTAQGGPSVLSSAAALPTDGLSREQDEEQFLEAAAMMDLPEEDREILSRRLEKERERRGMPGAFGPGSESPEGSQSRIVFSADDPDAGKTPPGVAPGTPSGRASASASGSNTRHAKGSSTTGEAHTKSFSYLNIIAGEHDEELFHRVSKLERQHVQTGSYHEDRSSPEEDEGPGTPIFDGPRIARPSKPRYYIVTDHKSQKIILVLRGSLSLGDIAADLTCESREFYFPDPVARGETAATANPQAGTSAGKGKTNVVPFPAEEASTSARASRFIDTDYLEAPLVHEGMYETSLGVGAINRPVHRAVRSALLANAGYSLDIAGHSLGAGVASLLAIMWANPETTLTTEASGLPPGRQLHSYCYACPATMSASLGRRCVKIITTYVYSYDFICRLSLGSIQDIRNAVAWILWEDQQESMRLRRERQDRRSTTGTTADDDQRGAFHPSDRSTPLRVAALLTRAFEHQAGRLDSTPEIKKSVEVDFLALRRTLEANMRNVELFVPGQLLCLFKGSDFLVDEEENREEAAAAATEGVQTTQATMSTRGAREEHEHEHEHDDDADMSLVTTNGSKRTRGAADTRNPNRINRKVPGKKQRGFVLRPPSHSFTSTSTSTSSSSSLFGGGSGSGSGSGGGGSSSSRDVGGGRVENLFDQVVFSRDLISCHMPSVYDAAIKGLIGSGS